MEIAVSEFPNVAAANVSAFMVPWMQTSAVVGTNMRNITLPPISAGGGPLYAYVRVRNGAGRLGGSTIARIR